jgi:hypothetical protein
MKIHRTTKTNLDRKPSRSIEPFSVVDVGLKDVGRAAYEVDE